MRGPSVRTALPMLALATLAVGHGAVRESEAPLPASLHAAGLPQATVVLVDGRPVRLPAPRPQAPRTTPRAEPREAAGRARRSERTRRAASAPVAPARPVAQAAAVPGDGYPWATDTSGARDAWGFTMRQCVSYVAWRLDGAVSTREGWGSALDWDESARAHGWTVSLQPRSGGVAQWDAGESSAYWDAQGRRGTFTAGGYGHVAWVLQVYGDGSVLVAQYNGTEDRAYSTMRVRAPRYLLR